MTGLPPDLAPWSDLLALFPPELAAGLGAWAPKLALIVGQLRGVRPTGSGEPDGITGIARRGSYERLLLTEWLLADEVPDEFVRRAIMNELAFLEIARRSPVRAVSSVVLFEAGPTQIGAPRIVHLAALIVLARRAEAAGARFAWGLLHDPGGALVTEVTRTSILHLLASRTALPASAEDVSAWAERSVRSGWEDVWVVGTGELPEGLAAAVPRFRPAFLEVRDVLEPGRREVLAIARAPSAPVREAELTLPAPRACARLLRDPFAAALAAPRSPQKGIAPTSNLVFSSNGSKLFARGAAGEIIAYPVPNSPRDKTGKPKRHRPSASGVVTAVGWVARGLSTLTVNEHQIVLEHTHPNSQPGLRLSISRADCPMIARSSAEDPLTPLLFRPYGPRLVTVALDADGDLFELSDDFDPPVSMLAAGVLAIAQLRQQIVYVGQGPAGGPTGPCLVNLGSDKEAGSVEELVGEGLCKACFGFAEGGPPDWALVAFQRDGEAWSIHGGPTLRAPEGTEVVGVFQAGAGAEPMLVLLGEDRRELSLVGLRTSRTLPRALGEIAHVTMSTSRAYLAYATTRGEVVILSLTSEAPLAQFVPEAE